MSEARLVPAHTEKTSLRMEHWKEPVQAPKILTPNSKARAENQIQALLCTWGEKTFPHTH